MGKLLLFLKGFFSEMGKMLLGSIVIAAIVGYFYFSALYYVVPLLVLVTLIESVKSGINSSKVYIPSPRQGRSIKKLKRTFNNHELFEFDKAWKNINK